MHSLLARAHQDVLTRYAESHVLLGFDFDGVLAPITSDPAQAQLRPATRDLLAELGSLYPLVVISGRARADVRSRLEDLPILEVIGNHGLEPCAEGESIERQVRQWRRQLTEQLGGLEGVVIEDKRFSLAIHHRHSPRQRTALEAIRRAVAQLGPARVVGGKCVVNVLVPGAPHKGTALLQLQERFRCDTALFVGDDDTDEDVFGLEAPTPLLAIRVGKAARSKAGYFLKNQREVDRLLTRLLELRRESQRVKVVIR